MPYREETPRKTHVTLLAWERLRILLEELEKVSRVREVWASLLRQLSPQPGPR